MSPTMRPAMQLVSACSSGVSRNFISAPPPFRLGNEWSQRRRASCRTTISARRRSRRDAAQQWCSCDHDDVAPQQGAYTRRRAPQQGAANGGAMRDERSQRPPSAQRALQVGRAGASELVAGAQLRAIQPRGAWFNARHCRDCNRTGQNGVHAANALIFLFFCGTISLRYAAVSFRPAPSAYVVPFSAPSSRRRPRAHVPLTRQQRIFGR